MRRPRQRTDHRGLAVALTLTLVLAGGAAIRLIDMSDARPPVEAPAAPAEELRSRFDRAVQRLQVGDHAQASTDLHRVLELAPELPEAHVNLGFAMLGLGRSALARDAFERATALRADQANAYYGLALAHEASGDLELALGAMRSYVHRARDADPAHLRRARAALWEWETRLRAAASAPR